MGKTNLLHVLISQLALWYPPEELELYLLDFKEVEFDAYLTERLPHARAITSRTDREFGLSMLRRFHDEINRRARLCREARVTDLPDYRQATGQVLPRALVIMDEFQVLFSEEDRLAREAGRLLADIAKRGAAFGLHLLLATQSPGGPRVAGAERRPAPGYVGVPRRRPGALLGDLPVVLGLGHGQRLLPLRLELAVFGFRGLELVLGLRRLPLAAGGSADERI
jgi:hypothetical protein